MLQHIQKIYDYSFNIKNYYIHRTTRASAIILANALSFTSTIWKKETIQIESDVTISLTSFPARIKRVHLVIHTLLQQTIKPKKIILWLSSKQFPKHEQDLPTKLRKLQSDIFTIKFIDEDLRSYKKYAYLSSEISNKGFIIVDDDVFYPVNTIETLLNTSKKHPGAVITNRGNIITENKPYIEWPNCLEINPNSKKAVLPTGVGGVYYPPNSLHPIAFNKAAFTSICPDADDIWLYASAKLNETKVVYSNFKHYPLGVKGIKNISLNSTNVQEGHNDLRIKEVNKYFIKNYNIKIF